jgi:hypothetical protein
MIVIGADMHKGSHALAAVDEGTGRVRGSREIKADDAGHLAAIARWCRCSGAGPSTRLLLLDQPSRSRLGGSLEGA